MKKLLILAFLLLGCFSMASYAAKPKAKHVVYIGLDGWGSYSMPKANMPTVKSLMETGCYTMQKRTVLPSSSAVNWASMFMGAGPEVHGYTEWGSRTPELPSRVIVKNNIFPTIFQIYRDANPKAEIGVLSEWAGIQFLVDTLSTDYHAVAPDYNKFPTALCEMAEKYIKENKPSLVAICFDNPDHVGHKEGHDTPAYYSKLEELDGYIARIVAAVKEAVCMMTLSLSLLPTTEVSRKVMAERQWPKCRHLLSSQERTLKKPENFRKAWYNMMLLLPWHTFSD